MKKFTADLPSPGPIFAYTAARSLEAMDQGGVSTAMLSCPSNFGDDPAAVTQDARVFTREINEYGAKLVADHRGRFGLFAMLPLPDTDASLREIEYAFDTLNADGVGLATSYGRQWLGDDEFDVVFQELNRRKAVVFSHPHDAPCCHNLLPNTGPQAVEWNTDTSRAIWNLIKDGSDAKSGPPLVTGDRVSSVTSKASRYGDINLRNRYRFAVSRRCVRFATVEPCAQMNRAQKRSSFILKAVLPFLAVHRPAAGFKPCASTARRALY